MRRVSGVVLVALLASGVLADDWDKSDPKEWYTPDGKEKEKTTPFTVYDWQTDTYKNYEADVPWDDDKEKDLADKWKNDGYVPQEIDLYMAIGRIAVLEVEARWQQAEIERLGERLASLEWSESTIKFKSESTADGGQILTLTRTAKKGEAPDKLGTATIPAWMPKQTADKMQVALSGGWVDMPTAAPLMVDGISVDTNATGGALQIKGWSTDGAGGTKTLAQLLLEGASDLLNIPFRNNGVLNYLAIGKLDILTNDIDRASLAINEDTKKIEMANFALYDEAATQEEPKVAVADGLGILRWYDIDNSTIGAHEEKFEIKDAHEQDAPNVYFGTGPDVKLGWYPLPLMITNDNRSIDMVASGSQGVLTLAHWREGGGEEPAPGDCETTLSKMLTDPEDEENRKAHAVITRKGTGENAELHYTPIGDLIEIATDDKAVTTNDLGEIALVNWSQTNACTDATISEMLTSDEESKRDSHQFLARTQGGELHYVEIGDKLDIAVKVDEKSVTTNTTAAASGELELVGFRDAKSGNLPKIPLVENGEDALKWRELHQSSLALASGKLEVKGAQNVGSAKQYFGTSSVSADIGWYDLPNVTTNAVEGDGKTIASVEYGGDIKHLGFFRYPFTVPSAAYMDSQGELNWFPIPDPSEYDNASISTNSTGKWSIHGWQSQGACGATLSAMLSDENDSENRSTHEVLCRVNGVLHYTAIGNLLPYKEKPDQAGSADIAEFSHGSAHATNAEYAAYADYAKFAGHALWAAEATNAIWATDAHFAETSDFAYAAQNAEWADRASEAADAAWALDAAHAFEADYADEAALATNAIWAIWATTATNALYAIKAEDANNAIHADRAEAADYAEVANVATNALEAAHATSAANALHADKADEAVFASALKWPSDDYILSLRMVNGAVGVFSNGVYVGAIQLVR